MPHNSELTPLERLSTAIARWTGSSWAFIVAIFLTLAWMLTGPIFHYSPNWQLAMNTVSSITTFIMVFLLQRSQLKDSLAMQIKLNEIIAALQNASNQIINIENLSEQEIRRLHKRYQALADPLEETPEKI